MLAIRARISARDAGGILGMDDLDVEVVLHRGIPDHELHLGSLDGPFGGGDDDWQDFRLDVPVLAVAFPADPCLGQDPSAPCGTKAEPRANGISFVFTGSVIHPSVGLSFEVDWMTLEPKDQPGLAWRPVLLAPASWRSGLDILVDINSAWLPGLRDRDIGFRTAILSPFGTIRSNGPEITAAVADLKDRFGVERVNIVGWCRGGLDAREHLQQSDQKDVQTLVMLATENEGSFLVDSMSPKARQIGVDGEDPNQVARGLGEITGSRMRRYNSRCKQNTATVYVAAAANHSSSNTAQWLLLAGPNDEFVSVSSVEALPYDTDHHFFTSENDPENQGCATAFLGFHLCLLTYPRIVDDLFRDHLAELTPPLPRLGSVAGQAGPVRKDVAPVAADPAGEEVTAIVQGVASDTDLIPADGVTQAHAILVDAADAVLFDVFVGGNLLRLELVSPSGRRIDAATPLTDPAVVHAPLLGEGPLSVTSYHLQAPETGIWTLEVTGTGAPAPDAGYAVTTLVQLPRAAVWSWRPRSTRTRAWSATR